MLRRAENAPDASLHMHSGLAKVSDQAAQHQGAEQRGLFTSVLSDTHREDALLVPWVKGYRFMKNQ